MELYERIKQVASLAGSETKLASRLGLPQTTFNGYLKPARQDNLWPLLPKILELYPQVRRDWLYFGEGEMTGEAGPRVTVPSMTTAVPPLETATGGGGERAERDAPAGMAELRQKLMAAHELNARLTDEVLRLNEERRKLAERLEWDKVSDKTVRSPLAAPGGLPEGN